jgi:hypothetical protein
MPPKPAGAPGPPGAAAGPLRACPADIENGSQSQSFSEAKPWEIRAAPAAELAWPRCPRSGRPCVVGLVLSGGRRLVPRRPGASARGCPGPLARPARPRCRRIRPCGPRPSGLRPARTVSPCQGSCSPVRSARGARPPEEGARRRALRPSVRATPGAGFPCALRLARPPAWPRGQAGGAFGPWPARATERYKDSKSISSWIRPSRATALGSLALATRVRPGAMSPGRPGSWHPWSRPGCCPGRGSSGPPCFSGSPERGAAPALRPCSQLRALLWRPVPRFPLPAGCFYVDIDFQFQLGSAPRRPPGGACRAVRVRLRGGVPGRPGLSARPGEPA